MQADSQQQYTILRIKRKRNEEPLDALVVEGARRKKTKGGGMNVFQFAETVEPTAWQDEQQKQDLQTRISTLAREIKTKRTLQVAQLPQVPVVGDSTNVAIAIPSDSQEIKTPRKLPQIDDPSRKYTIVPSESVQTPIKTAAKSSSRLTAPPKVHSYKELQKASFTMYEAIPSSKSLAGLAGPSSDAEVDKFLPMLNDYLRVSGEDSAPSASAATAAHDDDDYVWDVFYSRPATFRELYGMNNNIGSVSGLPVDDEHGSESDEDYDDEDDEDSNAEDWYKNDYPDEESASDEDAAEERDSEGSDVFHEDSDYEDFVHDRPSQIQMWDYR